MRLKTRNRIVTGALALLLVLMLVGALLAGAPPVRAAEPFVWEGRQAPVGLAVDVDRDRYWALDRATGQVSLTALGADGTVQGLMTSQDVLLDAVALAYVAGEAFVGDLGGEREEVTVYRITEPWPATEIRKAVPHVLAYPEGAEEGVALLVDAERRLHVVTAGEDPGIYRASATPSTTEPNPLERIADAPEGVTDATVLRDGRWVLRTELTIQVRDPETQAVLGEQDIEADESGYVISESLTDGELLTGVDAEGAFTLHDVQAPEPATPAPRPQRSSAPRPQAPDEEADTRTFEQTGTTAALVGAVVVAALAGLVVALRR